MRAHAASCARLSVAAAADGRRQSDAESRRDATARQLGHEASLDIQCRTVVWGSVLAVARGIVLCHCEG